MAYSTSDLLHSHRKGRSCSPFNTFLTSSTFLPVSMKSALVLRGHRGCINTCSFNPYGDLQLTGCDDGCVWLWDIGNRCHTPKLMLRPHITNVFTTNFLSHHRFVSGANDAVVQVSQILNDGRVRRTRYLNHHIRKVHSSFVVDENTFATCAHDKTVRLFDIRTDYRNTESDTSAPLTDADFGYDARSRLGSDLARHRLRPQGNGGGLEDEVPDSAIDNSSVLLDFRAKRGCELFQIDVHPIDRKRFLTCGCDGTIRLFDMRLIHRGDATERGFSVNPAYGRGVCKVTGAAFSDDGERIAASVIGGDIHVIDANQFVDLATLPPPAASQNPWLYVDDDGDGAAQQQVAPATGEIVRLVGHRSERTIKTCNWFGDFVVTGSDCGDVYFYEVETAKIVKILRGHQSPTNVVTVHREKRLLATSGVDDYATLWEPDSITTPSLAAVDREILEWQDENDRFGNQMMGCQVM